jgi:hypothetical protein
MSLTEWLAERGIGEMEGDDYHYPEYTHGCWGGRREPLCWLCKFRYIATLFGILTRSHDHDE